MLYKYETYIYPRFNFDVKVQINSKVQISPWVKFLVKKVHFRPKGSNILGGSKLF